MKSLLLAAMLILQGIAPPQARTGAVTGQILSKDGKPASEVRVAAMAVNDADNGLSVLAAISPTDSEGRYRLENILPGRYYISAGTIDLPTYFPGTAVRDRATIVTILAASTTTDLDFVLAISDGGRVSGKLAAPLAPPSGSVLVRALGQGTGPNLSTIVTSTSIVLSRSVASMSSAWDTTVGADGTFEFPKLPFGKYTISTTPDVGLAPVEVVTDGDQSGIELRARNAPTPSGVNVRGRVVADPGVPLPDDLVVVLSARGGPTLRTTVKNDGTFVFQNVTKQFVYNTGTALGAVVLGPSTVGVLDQDVNGIEIRLPPRIENSGHIETADGSPLTAVSWLNTTVEVRHSGVNQPAVPITASGAFKLSLLEGANQISLRNVPPEYTVISISQGDTDLIRDPLFPEATSRDPIRIRVASNPSNAMHRVSGALKGLPPAGIGNATKVVLSGFGPGHRIIETPVRADGTFQFPAVPADIYTTKVEGDFETAAPRIEVADADVTEIEIVGRLWMRAAGRVVFVDTNGGNLPASPFSYLYTEFGAPNGPRFFGSVVGADGRFSVPLYAGDYNLTFNNLPDGYAVKSVSPPLIRVDGTPMPEVLVTIERK